MCKMESIKGETCDMLKGAALEININPPFQEWSSLVPDLGVIVSITNLNNNFQVSFLGKRPRTMHLVRSALHCISGSMIPRPPSFLGRMIVGQRTLALVSRTPSEPPHRKFIIKRLSYPLQPSETLCNTPCRNISRAD